jgi:hypothetical protein
MAGRTARFGYLRLVRELPWPVRHNSFNLFGRTGHGFTGPDNFSW